VSHSAPRASVFADAETVAAAAAELVAQSARTAVAERGRFVLALSGGSTPRALYRLLAGPSYDGIVPWSATVLLWGDERCVPPEHPESNYHMVARTGLLDRPFAAVERIRGELGAEEAAGEYECRLRALADSSDPRALGGDGPDMPVPGPPVIDLVLLGIGADGHTASLLPASPALAETRRFAVPTGVYAGVRRVTLTVPVLAAARQLLFLVAGADKAPAVAEMLHDPGSRLPAALVLRAAGRATLLLDEAAAAGGAREVAPDPGVV
jgi:6-phosphogluconolactonase